MLEAGRWRKGNREWEIGAGAQSCWKEMKLKAGEERKAWGGGRRSSGGGWAAAEEAGQQRGGLPASAHSLGGASRRAEQAMDVYRTPAAALASLVVRRLQPSAEFQRAAWRALGALATTLRERGDRAAAQPWRVLKTAKVGALGAGGGRL